MDWHMNYDIFNGDADGIIALLQLRLATPQESTLITGVKRDINLVAKVDVQTGDKLTVLDISMEKNIVALELALRSGAEVFYADHHRAGDIPQHENLSAHIDLDANTCTALIIDNLLNGQFHEWAITAAYGDNLIAKADDLADAAGLSCEQKSQLKELGTLINYNGYGAKVGDLHFDPAELYQALLTYPSPFDVIADQASPFISFKLPINRIWITPLRLKRSTKVRNWGYLNYQMKHGHVVLAVFMVIFWQINLLILLMRY